MFATFALEESYMEVEWSRGFVCKKPKEILVVGVQLFCVALTPFFVRGVAIMAFIISVVRVIAT